MKLRIKGFGKDLNGNTGDYNTGYGNTGDFNTGYYNTGHFNTGDKNTGDSNTGYYNTGNRNTGDFNTGDYNTGYCNTGDKNTSYFNTGNRNTGDFNTGDYNTGYGNTGDSNTGDRNTGHFNTGDFNKCDYSSGFFCTQEPKARIFDIETNMTVREFRDSNWYKALCSAPFILTEWIDYTNEEKANYKDKELIDGYLKSYTYKEACANWWAKMSNENKEIIKTIPNFNAEKFYEITGIEVKNDES